MRDIHSMTSGHLCARSKKLIFVIGLALTQGLSASASEQWFNTKDHGFIIQASPHKSHYSSGETAVINGQIRFGHEGRGQFKNLPPGQLDAAKVEAFFPDAVSDVNLNLNRHTGTFSVTSQPLLGQSANVLTILISNKNNAVTSKLARIQAKLLYRVSWLNHIIDHLPADAGGKVHRHKDYLIAARDRIALMLVKIDAQLAQDPDLIARLVLPLEVDNKPTSQALYSTIMGGFRIELSFDPGSVFQGTKTKAKAVITNLRHKYPAFNWAHASTKDDSFVLKLNWLNQEIVASAPQSLSFGDSWTHEFLTSAFLSQPNAVLEAEVYKIKDWFQSGPKKGQVKSTVLLASSEFEMPFVSDSVKPVIAMDSAQPSVGMSYFQIAPLVKLSVSDSLGRLDPASIALKLNGQVVPSSQINNTITQDGAQFDLQATLMLNDSQLSEGLYQLSLDAKDMAGNTALPYQTQFAIDHTAPVLAVSGAPSAGLLTNQPLWNLQISAIDASPINTQVILNGQVVDQTDAPVLSSAITLQEGINTLEIKSTDAAGNIFSQSFDSITLDTIAPVLSSILPANNTTLNQLAIQFSGISNEPLQAVLLNDVIAFNLSPDKKSFSLSNSFVTEGEYTAHITAQDLAGNQAQASVTFKIVLSVLNSNLLSVAPAQDGQHLTIRGAAGAAKPGITVNASAGLFNRASTIAAQDGSFTIPLYPFESATVTATDPSIPRTDTATVTWGSLSGTQLSGKVMDTGDALTQRPPMPLSGVRVSLVGSTIAPVTTGADGVFQFTQPVTGDQVLSIDGTTATPDPTLLTQRSFSKTLVSISIGVSQSNVLSRPIYLPAIYDDLSTQTVTAAQGGVVTHPRAPGVSINIPANTVVFPNNLSSGKIAMEELKAEVATIPPLQVAQPDTLIALEPSGLKFTQPVEITLPNVNELPPGVQMVLMSMNSSKGVWEIDGLAEVSQDGSKVVSMPGAGITHFSLVYAAPMSPQVLEMTNLSRAGVDVFSGSLAAQIKMPGYSVMGSTVAPSLRYNTYWAKPSVVVSNLFDIPEHRIPIEDSQTFHQVYDNSACLFFWCDKELIQMYLNVRTSGSSWYQPEYITAQFHSDDVMTDKFRFEGVTNRAQLSFAMDLKHEDGSAFKTGLYPYYTKWETHLKHMMMVTRTVTSWTSTTAPVVAQQNFQESRLIEQAFPSDLGGSYIVKNKMESAAGKGWDIDGAAKIHSDSSGQALLDDGNGSIGIFNVRNSISTLVKGSDNVINLDPTSGVLIDNSETFFAQDKNNNTVEFTYANSMPVVSSRTLSPAAEKYSVFISTLFGSCWIFPVHVKLSRFANQIIRTSDGRILATDRSNSEIYDLRTNNGLTGVLSASVTSTTDCNLGTAANSPGGISPRECYAYFEFPPGLGPNNYDCAQQGTIVNTGVLPEIGFTADGPLHTSMNKPMGLTEAPDGTIVVADYGNHRVRKFNLNAQTSETIAGNGQYQVGMDIGDGGLANQAQVYRPRGLAYDILGNLYISSENGTIRKVAPNGYISTFAGTTQGGVLSNSSHASRLSLLSPTGLAVDNQNGYLYVADTGHHRIVRINLSTREANTIAGTGQASDSTDGSLALDSGLSHPTWLHVDQDGNLLVQDSGNNKVKKIIFETSNSGTLAFQRAGSSRKGVRKNPDGSWIPELQRLADGSWIRNFRSGSRQIYNSKGLQTHAIDRMGVTSTYEYDTQDRIVKINDPSNRSIVYSYVGDKLYSIHNTANPSAMTSFYYAPGTNHLTQVNYPDGTIKKFEYSNDGLMTAQIDQRGFKTQYTYNEWNRLIKSEHLATQTTLATQDAQNQTLANGHTESNPGQLQSVGTQPSGVQNLITDPKGNVTKLASNPLGQIAQVTDVDGEGTKIDRNLDGNPIKITNSDGNYQTFTYDPVYGDLISRFDSHTGITQSQTQDDYGNLTSETDTLGRTFRATFDANGNRIASIDPDNQQNTTTYNAIGQVLTQTDVKGRVVTYTYDNLGQVTQTKDTGNRITQYVYDDVGRVIQVIDPEGTTTGYEYNVMNRLSAVISPKNERTEYTYAATGELTQIKDSHGNITEYVLDALGRVVKKINPYGDITEIAYDTGGTVSSYKNPNGDVVSMEYDKKSRLLKKIFPEGQVTYAYNTDNRLSAVSNWESEALYEYDNIGNLAKLRTRGLAALADLPDYSIEYEYNILGQRTKMTDPVTSTSYGYGTKDLLTSLQVDASSMNSVLNYGYAYDIDTAILSATRPGGSTTFAYDSSGWLTGFDHKVGGSSFANYGINRSPAGQVTSVTRNSIAKTFEYDANHQVTKATNPEAVGAKASETFEYDAIHNRKQDNGGLYAYTQNGTGKSTDLLEQDYRYFYFYDANRNLRSKQAKGLTGEVVNYSYNSQNQLTKVQYYVPASYDPAVLWIPSSVATREVEFAYDVLGRRVQKKVTDFNVAANNSVRRYGYDGNLLLIEYNGSNQVLAHFNQSGPGADDVASVSVSAQGVTEGYAQSTGTYQLLKDQLGSVVDVLDSSGNRVQHYVYSVFGELLSIRDSIDQDVTASAPLKQPFTFTGREFDRETGLYYLRARYYDSSIGRFLQRDPDPGVLSVPASVVNAYSYVANNPVNLTDPNGESFIREFKKGMSAAWSSFVDMQTIYIRSVSNAFGDTGKKAREYLEGEGFKKVALGVTIAAATVATAGAAGAAAAGLAGVGSGFAGAVVGAAAGALVGGVMSGVLYELSGYGKFWDGFIAGAISGAIAGGMAGFSVGVENASNPLQIEKGETLASGGPNPQASGVPDSISIDAGPDFSGSRTIAPSKISYPKSVPKKFIIKNRGGAAGGIRAGFATEFLSILG